MLNPRTPVLDYKRISTTKHKKIRKNNMGA
jgi:hypothetical protein